MGAPRTQILLLDLGAVLALALALLCFGDGGASETSRGPLAPNALVEGSVSPAPVPDGPRPQSGALRASGPTTPAQPPWTAPAGAGYGSSGGGEDSAAAAAGAAASAGAREAVAAQTDPERQPSVVPNHSETDGQSPAALTLNLGDSFGSHRTCQAASGRWRLRVAHPNYADHSRGLRLPVDGPVRVVLGVRQP